MKMQKRFKNNEEVESITEELLEANTMTGYWDSSTITFFGSESRSILISGDVEPIMANAICSQILQLSSESEEAPIIFYLNTEGGSILQGLQIYDTLRTTPCPVVGIVMGACHSAGLFILQGADVRVAFPNSSFFYHEPLGAFSISSETESTRMHSKYLITKNKMNEIIKERAKIPKKIWDQNFANSTVYYFNAQQALEYKLIDEITIYKKRKKISLSDIMNSIEQDNK